MSDLVLVQHSCELQWLRSSDGFWTCLDCSRSKFCNSGRQVYCGMDHTRDSRRSWHNHTRSGRICSQHSCDRGLRVLLPPVSEGSPDVGILHKAFTGWPPFSESTTPVITSKIMGNKRPAHLQEGQELALMDSVWDMTIRCWH